MIWLISITLFSFLVLVAMAVLKWYELKSGEFPARFEASKVCDCYLEKQCLVAKKQIRKINRQMPSGERFRKILLCRTAAVYDKLKSFAVKVLLQIIRAIEKPREKKKNNSVSPYLRDISEYKTNEE